MNMKTAPKEIKKRKKSWLMIAAGIVVLSTLFSVKAPAVYADPNSTQVTCKDGTVVTAQKIGPTLDTEDFIIACGSHGYDGPGTTGGSPNTGCNPGSGSLTEAVFVPWYKYLSGETVNGKCSPVFPKTSKQNYDLAKGVPLILMAIIELLLRISGLIAIGFIIYGSIQYIYSQGSPDSLKGAKSTITNAIVGLVIVMLATGFVQFLGGVFQ
jgi:hypothetical protein